MTRPAPLRTLLPLLGILSALVLLGTGCGLSGDGEPIIITATPYFDAEGNLAIAPTSTSDRPTDTPIVPTPNPTRAMVQQSGDTYYVQPGDTLGTIATEYGLTIEQIIALNDLPNPDALEVGQAIKVPNVEMLVGPSNKLIPDSELVRSATSTGFDVTAFVKTQPGYLREYTEVVGNEVWTGVDLVDFVSRNYSVSPRLLLALLEYRAGWLTDPAPVGEALTYPLGIRQETRTGLLRQLLDGANALNAGYYGWKYRGQISTVTQDGQRVFYANDLNPGTVAVQRMLSVTNSYAQWQQDISATGFFQTYLSLFGDPFVKAIEPLIPADLTQPTLALPIPQGEQWVYTGGPHGGYNSGSAWSAIDLAPPKPPDELVLAQGACYVSPNWVTAAAPGIIAVSDAGYVLLDLDGDGDENTGWVIVYLHIDSAGRIPAGTRVQTGDPLGHPSCEGGISSGTHLHFARKYNGEWIPVQCTDCAPGVTVPPFTIGEWTAYGYPNQEYQGYMVHAGDDLMLQADQMREFEQNKIEW